VSNEPGIFTGILEELRKARLNTEYVYRSFKQSYELDIFVLRVEDTDKRIKFLKSVGAKLIRQKNIFNVI